MKVLLTGATGVLGRRVLPRLLAAGHEVTAAVRSGNSARVAQSLGATALRLDLFDRQAVAAAAEGHDAVVNLATHIPPMARAANPKAWAANDRLRVEASANLSEAARSAGAQVFVQESVAFSRGDHGEDQLPEGGEMAESPVTASVASAEAAAAAATDGGLRGIVLRFGLFHAPDSDHGRAFMFAARHGRLMVPGEPDAYIPIIHADDAASAVVAALGAPAGTYEITTDQCPTRAELAEAASAALQPLGVRRVRLAGRRTRARIARSAGPLAWSQRVGNTRMRDATGWRPAHRDARSVWAAFVAGLSDPAPVPSRWAKVALAILAVFGLQSGLWAGLAPESFYDEYPGLGRQWVAADGPFNEHLVRDVGWTWVGLALVAVAALVVARRPWARLAGVAWLAFGLPHFIYHALHLHAYDETVDQVGVGVSTALLVVVSAVAIWSRPPAPTRANSR